MASVKFEKGSTEWYMFQDFYKLCQRIWIIEDNDEYWDYVKNEIDAFCGKYKGNIFAKHLAFALLNTLEEKEKIRRGKLC